MRILTDTDEIKDVLGKYYFMMFNARNKQLGELTTLSEQDIKDILWDMSLDKDIAPKVAVDGDRVVVQYPANICRLESRDMIKERV